jgi:hypothetical protein
VALKKPSNAILIIYCRIFQDVGGNQGHQNDLELMNGIMGDIEGVLGFLFGKIN